jgi:hypothetical protein
VVVVLTIVSAKTSWQVSEIVAQTYVDGAIPVLSARVLYEPSGSFDRGHSTSFRQDKLFEFGTKVRCPSIGCVDDCPSSQFATIGGDSYPSIVVFL